ncbi:MAG: hypothetical protein CMJ48_02915 [Planctomycetaceae bacterium]|nr:hypothetical protein [Planctomycetaceae bacterium]
MGTGRPDIVKFPERTIKGGKPSDLIGKGNRAIVRPGATSRGNRLEKVADALKRGPGAGAFNRGKPASIKDLLPNQRLQNRFGKNGVVAGALGKGRPGKLPAAQAGKGKPGIGRPIAIAGRRTDFLNRLQGGKLDRIAKSHVGSRLGLQKQFLAHRKGDAARRLSLIGNLKHRGGWHHRHQHGHVAHNFIDIHFSSSYCGPSWCPSYVWTPHWSPWVDWCWWDHCHPVCDPRPIWCRPVYCHPCPVWVPYDCPVWIGLPEVVCGTWVDVEPIVIDAGLDLQLLAVRFVDSGHVEKDLGPRYRVWFRNNSPRSIVQPFNVVLLASNSRDLESGLPEAGLRIVEIAAGETQSVDIRLPAIANRLDRDSEGRKLPFRQLHVLVDSHREVPEAFEVNNGVILARGDVLPVDPAAFASDVDVASAGSLLNIAGEGFGPEPGQAIVVVNGLELQAEIQGWYDLGVQIKLPMLPLAAPANAELIIVRGDEAAANPLEIQLLPAGTPIPKAEAALKTEAPPMPQPPSP